MQKKQTKMKYNYVILHNYNLMVNKFGHTLVIVGIDNHYSLSGIKIASHTLDSYNKPISEYNFKDIRFAHIEGVR